MLSPTSAPQDVWLPALIGIVAAGAVGASLFFWHARRALAGGLLEAIPEPSWLLDRRGRVRAANRAAREREGPRSGAPARGGARASAGRRLPLFVDRDALRGAIAASGSVGEWQLEGVGSAADPDESFTLTIRPLWAGAAVFLARASSRETVHVLAPRARAPRPVVRDAAGPTPAGRADLVGQLAAGLAHDFNNLLTSILGYSEMLIHRIPEGSPERSELEEIRDASRRGAALTRQLSNLGHDNGSHVGAVDVIDVIDALRRMVTPLLGDSRRLAVSHGTDEARVLADPAELEKALLALVLVVRDGLPSDGAIRISTSIATSMTGTGDGGPPPPGGCVMVDVRDAALGDDASCEVADPVSPDPELVAAHAALTRAGAVLRLSRRATGVGRAVVLLPRIASTREAPVLRDSRLGQTILVVEDEALVRRLICSGLRGAGYRVIESSSAGDAGRLAAETPLSIDLAVCDVVLPDGLGIEVVESLRAGHGALRALFVSGYGEDVVARLGVRVDGEEFLAKPFTTSELLARVRGLLRLDLPTGS